MKSLNHASLLGVLIILVSGHAFSAVTHPENTNIVGGVFLDSTYLCFNNDGVVVDPAECDTTAVDEGVVFLAGGAWKAGGLSGIRYCGTASRNPVSDANCVLQKGVLKACVVDEHVLVMTTQGSYYWSVKSNVICDEFATPETSGVTPCLSTDAFESQSGCFSPDAPEIKVRDGYLQAATDDIPPELHCSDDSHLGRIVVHTEYEFIYICTKSGWIVK